MSPEDCAQSKRKKFKCKYRKEYFFNKYLTSPTLSPQMEGKARNSLRYTGREVSWK